jgi:hypothetical protein
MKLINWLACVALIAACDSGNGDGDSGSSGAETTNSSNMTEPTDGGGEDETQVPPQGYEAIEAWLTAGHYKSWKKQPGVVEPIPISPHGKQQIYTNQLHSDHAGMTGEYPVNAAAVKELYADDGTTLVGYAVYLHISAGTTGANWYWYERIPKDSDLMPDPVTGVFADGVDEPQCVGCHSAAGIDAEHPGHDFVYTQL